MTTLKKRYEIREKIGQGGMASVWSALDHNFTPAKLVAIKFLSVHLRDPVTQRKFAHECSLLAQLDHPNIVTITDSGVDAEDTPFYVMKYLRGHDLHSEIEGGAIPWRRAVSIATEVASALHAAHAKNVIHRDIKPGNIFIVPGRRDQIKLLDFGVATVLDAERNDESLTPAGCAVGTVHYIPPELVQGKRADERSDIYSLGVTLYRMVTGQLPFTSDAPRPARDHNIMQMHVQTEPVSPRRLNPDIPPALDAVILRCMQKDPSKRFASAERLVDELENLLSGDLGKRTLQFRSGRRPIPAPKYPGTPTSPSSLPLKSPPTSPPSPASHSKTPPGSQWSRPLRFQESPSVADESPSVAEASPPTSQNLERDITAPERDGEEVALQEQRERTVRFLFRTTVGFTTVSVFVAACMFFTIIPSTGAMARAIVDGLRRPPAVEPDKPKHPKELPVDESSTTSQPEDRSEDASAEGTTGNPEDEDTEGTSTEGEDEIEGTLDTEGTSDGVIDTDGEGTTDGTPSGATTGGEPQRPKRRAKREIRSRTKDCRSILPIEKTIEITVEFDESGTVTSAEIQGVRGEAYECVKKQLENYKLKRSEPPSSGKIEGLKAKI